MKINKKDAGIGPNVKKCFWPNAALFIFVLFSVPTMTNIVQKTINEKSVDGVLEIRTQDRVMVGADASTELLRPPSFDCLRQ